MARDPVLRALDDAVRSADSTRVEVDDRYLRLIARIEADPANRTGADKSWVIRATAMFRTKPPSGR